MSRFYEGQQLWVLIDEFGFRESHALPVPAGMIIRFTVDMGHAQPAGDSVAMIFVPCSDEIRDAWIAERAERAAALHEERDRHQMVGFYGERLASALRGLVQAVQPSEKQVDNPLLQSALQQAAIALSHVDSWPGG